MGLNFKWGVYHRHMRVSIDGSLRSGRESNITGLAFVIFCVILVDSLYKPKIDHKPHEISGSHVLDCSSDDERDYDQLG
jgi:hypothetical protein